MTPEDHLRRGRALAAQGRDPEAVDAFGAVLLLEPRNVRARIDLAELLVGHGLFEEAIVHLQVAASESPADGRLRLTLAQALTGADRSDEAEKQLLAAMEDPEVTAMANGMLGYWYQARGCFTEARSRFEASVALQPVQSLAYYGWGQANRVATADEPVFVRACEAAASPRLDPADAVALRYFLGKAYADLGDYERSMAEYDKANAGAFSINLGGRPFNRKRYAEIVDGTIVTFGRDAFTRHRAAGSASRCPIFVVGMMRSGTTLVEQILSSHPSVAGAGEVAFWLDRGREAFDPIGRKIVGKSISPLAQEYLSRLQARSTGCARVVDKMPQNFQMLGLIHLAFPNAPIIHIRRHPVDTCLSIYTTAYEQSPDFAHDRASIVFAYRQYLRLVQHWRKVLPGNRLFEMDYEDLVADFETVARRLVRFCGLEWDDACLTPHHNQRIVATPSLWQVRQPIYGSSVGRWRLYEPWLGEFSALGQG